MIYLRIVLFLFISLNMFGNETITDPVSRERKKISLLTKEAARYLSETNYEKSFLTSRLALHQAFAINDDYLIAKSYNNIAATYEDLSEFEKAIFYYKKGLMHANKTANDTIKSALNNNLGNVYCFERKEFDEGLNYYNKSLEYGRKIADSSQIYITELNLAWAYFYSKNFKKGKPYLDFINTYKNKYGGETTAVALNMLNGMYFGNRSEYEKASSFFLAAIKFGNEIDEKWVLSYTYKEYAMLLMKMGNYKEAYENLILYNDIRKELEDSEKQSKANMVGINLELDEYKRKVDVIELEKELQYESLQQSRIIVLLFGIITAVSMLLIYLLYRNYNFKKKKNLELIAANEQLSVAKKNAEVASQLKSQFVSTITHELRTPLYGVLGITNMLLDEHKELANSPHLGSLKFSARYLLSLVNDVLQINKIEENRIVLENLTFNISDEINMIKNSLSFIAKNHTNSINVNVDPSIPEYLIGDKLRFSQILINLVSNALKFTKNGEVNINANLIKVEDRLHFIEFQIQDNGLGIAEEDQEKIFEKFVQIGRKEIDYQGTGLGLSIVKRLLELFNSTISLESKVGEGTTFTFTIAFDYDPIKTNNLINNIQVDLSTGQIFNVLVVDDNSINQLVTKKLVEKHNYKCTVVDSGSAAIEMLDTLQFDAILMDINMPVMNGFETTRRIREKGISTPIIALTAFDKEEVSEEALSAGMNDILIKPFAPALLVKTINQLIFKVSEATLV
ncbi:MAG: signal transduction histidine kinase/CheY-like chemotaxis protein [Saprospiraceae bacterium]|jgi:signal transduction histidine kinase/CheY-like chemotaxis protein